MLDLMSGFVVELRNAGLPVSLTENLDAMEAVKHIPIEDRDAFKYALATTLVKNEQHWRRSSRSIFLFEAPNTTSSTKRARSTKTPWKSGCLSRCEAWADKAPRKT